MVSMARSCAGPSTSTSEVAMSRKPIFTKHEVPVSPFDAFRAVATAYGVKDLAERLSMKPGTLWNKVDADVESHHQPTLRDVILQMIITSDNSATDIMIAKVGGPAAVSRTSSGVTPKRAMMSIGLMSTYSVSFTRCPSS